MLESSMQLTDTLVSLFLSAQFQYCGISFGRKINCRGRRFSSPASILSRARQPSAAARQLNRGLFLTHCGCTSSDWSQQILIPTAKWPPLLFAQLLPRITSRYSYVVWPRPDGVLARPDAAVGTWEQQMASSRCRPPPPLSDG